MIHRCPQVLCVFVCGLVAGPAGAADIDLSKAVVVVRPGERDAAETMAATILVEEVKRRTGVNLSVQDEWPAGDQPAIAITTADGKALWSERVPRRKGRRLPERRPEGYAIRITAGAENKPPAIFVIGADGRGAMFGVGRLLRALRLKEETIRIGSTFGVATAPAYAIRGHQLGYRARANSWDAWTPEQFDQHIRELVIFGANCIENIPFEDERKNPLMKVSREQMNLELSRICARYGIGYWVWTPADFALTDQARREVALQQHERLYQECPRLDAVFFPGGDPGDNPPELVIPFLKDLATRLAKHHPRVRIWVSLQGFDRPKAEHFLEFVTEEKPAWLGGLVGGPSSPPLGPTRLALPKPYKLRWYPDITHTVRCQFPVDSFDPAFALTLGREPVNPRPSDYASIFRAYAPHTDGFLTYSDGIHDDVNKAVWSMLGWNPRSDVREMLVEYARFFFGAGAAQEAADALLGLESNWRGSLAANAGVEGVLALWQRLEKRSPELLKNWRFQVHLMRAYYDAYTRQRLIHETRLERDAMKVLGRAKRMGADRAMQRASQVLRRAETQRVRSGWRKRIEALADAAFKSIGYQTSVERYHGSSAERGCVMDFVDYPLNNRWWLEDEFAEIRKMSDEKEKLARLEVIRKWENPGPGSYYDDIGHVGRSPHVIRGEGTNTDPELWRHENASHSWWDEGKSRQRLSWQHHMRWPVGLAYDGLDPAARYSVRVTGQGESPLRGDGVRIEPTRSPKEIGAFKEFTVPAELTADGALHLTWDKIDESHLNWRQHSHAAEVWLLKQ